MIRIRGVQRRSEDKLGLRGCFGSAKVWVGVLNEISYLLNLLSLRNPLLQHPIPIPKSTQSHLHRVQSCVVCVIRSTFPTCGVNVPFSMKLLCGTFSLRFKSL